MALPSLQQLDLGSGTLCYRQRGSGPLVVLLHGFGEDGSVWNAQLDYLASHYTVLVPDLPGVGKSDLQTDMSMEGLASLVHQVVQTITTAPHCLIGHSMGGYIALAYAQQYPGALAGLGLFHSTPKADTPERVTLRKKAIDFVQTHGAHPFLTNSLPSLFAPVTREGQPALIKKHLERSYNFSPTAIVRYYEAMLARPDRSQLLERFDGCVLLVAGRFDEVVPPEDTEALSRQIKEVYFYTLDASGHMGMLEEPDQSNMLLERYLKAVFEEMKQ